MTNPGGPDDPVADIAHQVAEQLLALEQAAADRDPEALQRYADAFSGAVNALASDVTPMLESASPDVRHRIGTRVGELQQQMQRVFAMVSLRASQTQTALDVLRQSGVADQPRYTAAGRSGSHALPSRALGHA